MHPHCLNRPRQTPPPLARCTAVLWLLLGLLLLSAPAYAQAQDTSPHDSPLTTPRATPQAKNAPLPARFDIDLQAPRSLRTFILTHLELQRLRSVSDLDATELERLIQATPEKLRQLLATKGYFSPHIQLGFTPAPSSTAQPLGTVTLQIDPGPVTRIAALNIYYKGHIANAPEAAAQREAIRASLSLASGQPFSQTDWEQAKANALRQLTAQRYPLGRIDNSLADIDAPNHRADLYLELDSGPLVQLGPIRPEGIERYDPAILANLLRLEGLGPGSTYALSKLQAAQQRLAQSGYFDSVYMHIDTSGDPLAAPVVVQVRESKRQLLVIGAGGSTDKGPRLSVEHTHHRVPGIGWRAVSKLQLERKNRLLSTTWTAPTNPKGWNWMHSAQITREIDTAALGTTSERLRTGQAQDGNEFTRSLFLQYDRSIVLRPSPTGPERDPAESALSANYAWTRRNFENPSTAPPAGQGLSVELGAGTTLGKTRRPFLRAQAHWLGYWPLDTLDSTAPAPTPGNPPTATTNHETNASTEPTPEPSGSPSLDAFSANAASAGSTNTPSNSQRTGRAGRIALRLQGGALWANPHAPVPESQLFLTGGDTTVRGYGLRQIGVSSPENGSPITPGRYMGSASLEWQRPLWRQGTPTPWESVIFLDAGAVANSPSALRPQWGIGTGVRYNSPIGPLQIDLAYGLNVKRFRLHMNVGFNF